MSKISDQSVVHIENRRIIKEKLENQVMDNSLTKF